MAFEAQDEMIIAKILAEEGVEIKVGAPMLVTVEKSSDVAAFADFVAPTQAAAAPKAVKAPEPVAAAAAAAVAAAPVAAAADAPRVKGERVFASPLARKLARDAGIDITTLAGTGPNGRIIAADVKSGVTVPVSAAGGARHSVPVSSLPAAKFTTSSGTGTGVYTDFELSNLALGVSARYTHAKHVVPHYFLSVDLDLTKMLALRKDLSHTSEMNTIIFFMKAAACAMKEVPDVNGAWMDSFIRSYEQVDINLIMGAGAGLVTPVIRDIGSKGLKALANELTDLEDSLFADNEGIEISSTAELAPGTFSIHDLGMFGIKSATPIVLPPQSCALALGAIVDSVVPHPTTKWTVAPVMTATLSIDHRVVDGAVAAQWLSAFKVLIENPVSLML